MNILNYLIQIKKTKVLLILFILSFFSIFIYKKSLILGNKLIDDTLIKLGFILKDLDINKIDSIKEKEIFDNIVYYKCSNLFCINLEQTKNKLKTIGWIKGVNLTLVIPDKLKVLIEEEVPKYIYYEENLFYLLNKEGKVITQYENVNKRYENLLLLSGEKANKKLEELSFIFSGSPSLAEKITKARLVSDRRWSLLYSSNITIDLPEKNAKEAFRKVQEIHDKYGLLSNKLRKIDLRIKDRMIIKLDMNRNFIKESKI